MLINISADQTNPLNVNITFNTAYADCPPDTDCMTIIFDPEFGMGSGGGGFVYGGGSSAGGGTVGSGNSGGSSSGTTAEQQRAQEYSDCVSSLQAGVPACISSTTVSLNSDYHACVAGSGIIGGIVAILNGYLGVSVTAILTYGCGQANNIALANVGGFCQRQADEAKQNC